MMTRTFTSLSLLLALTCTQAYADQATYEGLKAAGVKLTGQQAQEVAEAETEALPEVIASLVAANPAAAPTIVATAVCTAPDQAQTIPPAAVSELPEQAEAINAEVALGCPAFADDEVLGRGLAAPTSSIPSGGGAGGGELASPN
ncbi:hypothetical protein SAMN05216296_0860 [Pseudomonas pohangensis]|uniref:Uncharacterized protein n=1 Tax=Pseudomonas pohangensis TaxID=364197 RepID=A0A1H2EKJ7_9PSED|nr:hypothetical protein [Pseudomonas pohangensis]SDT95483.1 hypothetical protein SAMN05216296_0860 [Pseudomonas pohangensis]